MLAADALLEAIYAALTGSAAIQGLVGLPARVYDDVPDKERFPYITIGPCQEMDDDTSTERGSEHFLDVHVWSRQAGRKEARIILSAVHDLLHDQPLTLTGHVLINLRHQYSDVFRDQDGETLHGVARFRAVTEPSA